MEMFNIVFVISAKNYNNLNELQSKLLTTQERIPLRTVSMPQVPAQASPTAVAQQAKVINILQFTAKHLR